MMFSKLFASVVVLSGCVYSFTPTFYKVNNDWSTGSKSPTYSTSSITHLNDWKNVLERKMCGESLQHVAGLVVDKTDKEAKVIVEGSIRTNKLILKLGCVKEKEIYIKNILLPIETVSSKCINIRQKIQEDSTILCLDSKFIRNFWINSITDAVLCLETRVRGKLPQYTYSDDQKKTKDDMVNTEITNNETEDIAKEEIEEITKIETEGITDNESEQIANVESIETDTEEPKNESTEMSKKEEDQKHVQELKKEKSEEEKIEEAEEEEEEKWKQNILKEEFEDEIEKKEEQKGLKLRIAKSKYGYPNVKINGTDIQKFKNKNKSGELRSTSTDDNENFTDIENENSKEVDESTIE